MKWVEMRWETNSEWDTCSVLFSSVLPHQSESLFLFLSAAAAVDLDDINRHCQSVRRQMQTDRQTDRRQTKLLFFCCTFKTFLPFFCHCLRGSNNSAVSRMLNILVWERENSLHYIVCYLLVDRCEVVLVVQQKWGKKENGNSVF